MFHRFRSSLRGAFPLAALAAALLFLTSTASAVTLSQIQSQIQTIINGSSSQVQWSVLIENEWDTQEYFTLNADTMRRPASNTKIFTAAAALEVLGPTYVWRGYQLQSSSTASPMEKVLSNSDNALADELFGLVGGESAVFNWMNNTAGVGTTGANMDDGSGLDYDNRFSSRQTIKILRRMRQNWTYGQWSTHLAISCTKGTLASRICGTGKTGRVHAKTGTLTNGGTLALSGYVDNVNDGQRYYFSIYCNNVPSQYQTGTRDRIDNIVGVMCQAGIPNPGPPGAVEVIVDNGSSGFAASANWWTGSSTPGYYGSDYHVRSTEAVSDTAKWTANLPSSGNYQVYVRYTSGSNRATAAGYIVTHTGGNTTVNVNQQANGGTWVLLGTFNMASGSSQRVQLSCWTTSGTYVIADAVRFVKQ